MNKYVIVAFFVASSVMTEVESSNGWYGNKYYYSWIKDNATARPKNWACYFESNHSGYDWEPIANPLTIKMQLTILHIRDIPDSGGSFGLDLE